MANKTKFFKGLDGGAGKAALGDLLMAALMGTTGLWSAGSAAAQVMDSLPCPETGICDLGTLKAQRSGYSRALGVSSDGSAVVGQMDTDLNVAHGFYWTGTDLYDLGSFFDPRSSEALFISADGLTVAGESYNQANENRVYRWTMATGLTDIGTLTSDGRGNSYVYDLSSDGSTLVGEARVDGGGSRAFRWKSGVMTDLGSLRGASSGESYATAVSRNGFAVVGEAETSTSAWRAFRYTDAELMRDLGTLRTDGGGDSRARAVSEDGQVVVGFSASDQNVRRAFKWTEAGGMVDLGSINGAGFASDALAISPDGTVIAGESSTGSGITRATLWAEGGMLDLGVLRPGGSSSAKLVSGDGKVVVGQAEVDQYNWQAFRWTDDGEGMIALGTLRSSRAGQSRAYDVSFDGSVIVGEAEANDGSMRAFIFRTEMQDLTNLYASFPRLADATAHAMSEAEASAAFSVDAPLTAPDGKAAFSIAAEELSGEVSDRSVGRLSYGRGIDRVTVGGSLSLETRRFGSTAFDAGRGLSASLWARYSETGSPMGLAASAVLGAGETSGRFLRGRAVENVMLASGESDLETSFAAARVGYGFAAVEGLVVTPSLALARYHTTRDGYAESGADFTAEYDTLSGGRTTATFALAAQGNISETGTVSVGLGIERDLSRTEIRLAGTSNVPDLEELGVGTTMEARRTRSSVTLGYEHAIGTAGTLSGVITLGQTAFGGKLSSGLALGYKATF